MSTKRKKKPIHAIPPSQKEVDVNDGLSSSEVHERKTRGLVNIQPKSITRTTGQILRENIITFFNLLNIGIFIALLIVDSYNNLFFMGVVLSNMLIGIVQELRSKRTVEKLSLLHAPHAYVIRDGQEHEIDVNSIVQDDILCLSLGQQIPTDCILLQGAIETDESHLSGESRAQYKQPGDTLLSGSAVLSGSCRARVEHIGAACYANALAYEARRYKRPKSELMHSLRLIMRFTGGLVVPLGVLMFSRSYIWLGHSIKSSVEQTAASMLGMIPAGLMLLASVSLAIGVVTLGRKKMLAQRPHCIETLSRVDMLCLDKTGTLTTGNLSVTELLLVDPSDSETVRQKLAGLVHTMPPLNPTARALHAYCGEDAKGASVKNMQCPTAVTDFSSARRYSAATFADCTLYLGAPELLCPTLPEQLRDRAKKALEGGYRILAFAAGPPAISPDKPDHTALTLYALLLLRDEIRPEAAKTLSFFQGQDVAIKIISGDNPQTAAHIARRLGVPYAERYIDVSLLDESGIEEAAKYYTVFGRAAPLQKKQLILALKRQGHTVAMTGDGVNDLLAMRESDCSIALYNGSDAARQISDLVLLTNDFAALPAAVMEGRRVINNITRTASLFLVKTIYSFLLTASSVVIGLAYPFQPVQLTLISAVTVGLPSFFLSLEPNRSRIEGNFLENVLVQAIPGGILAFIYALIAGMLGPDFGLSQLQVNTLCVYLTGTACLLVLLRVCLPLQNYRGILFFAMVCFFFGGSWLFSGLLRLMLPPNASMIWMYAIMAAACFPLLAGFSYILRRIMHYQ